MTNSNIFNAKLNDFPTETIVRISYYSDSKLTARVNFDDVTIPTSEVFENGDIVSRKSSGVKFSFVERWLKEKNLYPESVMVSGLWSTLRIL